MRDLKIAYGNFRNAAFWSNKTITFDELCDRLKEPIRTSESAEEYPKLTKAQRDEIKDKGEWKKGLQYNNRTGKIENNLHNIRLIMENDSYMKHIVFNQLADGMEIVGEVPWDYLHDLTYSVAVGSEADRLAALQTKADIYIINRENVQWLIEKSGLPFDFDMLVIDELSSFKSHQSKRFKALMKVRPKVKRIVGLTGTPSSNGLMDLFAEFKLLDMGKRLGRFIGQYRYDYFLPDKRNGMVVYSYKPLPDAEERIYEKISDITISMKADDHLQMPELVISDYPVQLSSTERKHYDALKKEMVLQLDDTVIDAGNAASLSNKLCQMANGAVYDENKKAIQIHDRKLDALEDMVEAANGKPLLVAYWFQHDLQRIMKRLQEKHIPFSEMKSASDIRRWTPRTEAGCCPR